MEPRSRAEPLLVFYSYSHEDEEHREKLEQQLAILKRRGLIDTWQDRQILAGTNRDEQIHEKLSRANIILLLVSPDFLASDYCWQAEVRYALERHGRDDAVVIPILVRPVDNWQEAPFGHLTPLPKSGKPVTTWADRDEAWADVAHGIREHVERTKEKLRTSLRPVADGAPPIPVASPSGSIRLPGEAASADDDALRETAPDLQAAVKDLIRDRPKDVREQLRRAVELLEASVRGPDLNLEAIQNIAVFFLQEMLGSGAKVEWGQDRDIIGRVLSSLREACPSPPAEAAMAALYNQIFCVIRCLSALRGDEIPPSPPLPDGDEPLSLLPVWVQVYERWLAISRSPEDPDQAAMELWERARRDSLPALSAYLARRYSSSEVDARRSLPSVRILHSIWFCLLLLRDARTGRLSPKDPAIQDVRACLSHVLRESLRFLCFGERADYYFDTHTYTRSLRKIVVHHAGLNLGPRFRYGIESLMKMIGKEGGVNRYAPAEHLQHVLETYMAGHFILSMRLSDGTGELDGTIADVLSKHGRLPDDKSLSACHQAFILAALFHDVGLLFLPSVAMEPGKALGLRIIDLTSELNELGTRVRGAFGPLAERCAREMQAYVAEADDDEFRRWLLDQGKRLGHGLLGAWYLHQFCRNLYPEGEPWSGFQPVLSAAVRAIMLHNALRVPIDAARDPIASLLVLCDELFEWDPSQPVMASSIGRSLQVIATEIPVNEPRDRSIRTHALMLESSAGDLQVTLDIRDQKAGWPRIDIEMRGPQRLQIPMFQVWLRKSRNLGRIRPAPCGWGPTLVVTCCSPFEGQLNKTLIQNLLEDELLSSAQKEALQHWLDEIHIDAKGMIETAHLGPFERPYLHAALEELRSAYVDGVYRVARRASLSPGQQDTRID